MKKVQIYELKWCYTRDLNRRNDYGITRREVYKYEMQVKRRISSLVNHYGGLVTILV